MSDKFPEIASIDKDLPDVEDGVDGSDFLSRENELVGDEFKTENDSAALADSDDEINNFKEQFPDVEEQNTQEPAEEDDEPEPSYELAPVGSSRHLEEWKERRDLEISEREKANSKKKEDIVAKAQQTIDDFYDNYNSKKEGSLKEVLKEQEQFLEKRDGFLKRGTLWDRVGELVDGVGELPADDSRDKTRFKELLKKLKGKEDVPGAAGY